MNACSVFEPQGSGWYERHGKSLGLDDA